MTQHNMYVAEKEVEKVENGTVTYKDGKSETYSEEWASYLVTENSTPEDKFRFYKVAKFVSDTMKALKDGRFDSYEVENAIDVLHQSLNSANNKAICEKFGVDDPKHITFDVINGLALIHDNRTSDV